MLQFYSNLYEEERGDTGHPPAFTYLLFWNLTYRGDNWYGYLLESVFEQLKGSGPIPFTS